MMAAIRTVGQRSILVSQAIPQRERLRDSPAKSDRLFSLCVSLGARGLRRSGGQARLASDAAFA